MADISLILDAPMEDFDDDVFDQGDCSGPPSEEEMTPLFRVMKCSSSQNSYDRAMLGNVVQEVFRTAPADLLEKDLPEIMKIIEEKTEIDSISKQTIVEHIPRLASEAVKNAHRVEGLKNVVNDCLLPLLVRNLDGQDSFLDKAVRSSLLQLMERNLINKFQVEIQVCPTVLALSSEGQDGHLPDINSAITLMSKMVPLLGQDVTERVFLKRFSELCSSNMFYVRKSCASHIGDFCTAVGKEQFEKVLLPCYVALCNDDIWGVRKCCADVIMFVSTFCPPEIRKEILAPLFTKLLKDDSRWVQMSAFRTLGPFISTFADPPITRTTYNDQRTLIFINNDGSEFLVDGARVPDVNLHYKFLWKQASCEEMDLSVELTDCKFTPFEIQFDEEPVQSDKDIKEIVETVKSAVLSYKNVEQEHDVIGDNLKINLNNVIGDIKNDPTCDNLGSTSINELANKFEEMTLERCDEKANEPQENTNNQVIESENEDDLQLYNSYNYWYISPDIPLDLNIGGENIIEGASNSNVNFNGSLQDSGIIESSIISSDSTDIINEKREPEELPEAEQTIVPKILLDHFVLMTDAAFATNIDTDMAYHCAYSLPAVAMTLESKNFPLLKLTIEKLAGNMQYKVRRTVASYLHELAVILGQDVATEYLTPIFDGFIKDLDEVRIGILKNLAQFMKMIKPEKRVTYLPRLHTFLKTENESNWRFRYELGEQLLLLITLFKPVEVAKHIGLVAEKLLYDVSAVREIAIDLIVEVLKYIQSKPGLSTFYLVRLIERFAHSKEWKRRQTFVILCNKLLATGTLPPEQFAMEVMPHLLDLSWDPVANVRLVVAKTIAQNIITNEYFSDPNNQHYGSLTSVVRRLQSDKDRDVRYNAQCDDKEISSNPLPIFS